MKYLKNIVLLFLIAALLSVLGGIGLLYYYSQELPDFKKLAQYDPPQVTRIYAGDGALFQEYATEKRIFVPIQAIPDTVIKAFLAVEDSNFYNHPGLDIESLIRAFMHNVWGYVTGSPSLMGGSTITQQVAKYFLLTHERTIARKIKEAILAFRIENAFSKDKILELYLNEIYLGNRAYGVAAAARQYFNKSLKELSVEETAFLAGLPKAPNNYNPHKYPSAALGRRNHVISRMLATGLISPEEAIAAKQQPIIVRSPSDSQTIDAPYFAEDVRREIMAKYGEKALYEGGLSIRTSLDSKLQKIAQEALKAGLIANDQRRGFHGVLGHISNPHEWAVELKNFKIPKGGEQWKLAVVINLMPNQVQIGLKNGTTGIISFDSMQWARLRIDHPGSASTLGPALKEPSDILKVGDVILVDQVTAMTYTLEQIPDVNGAVVVMDPHTGRVLAMSGGFSYGTSQFNRATQAMRQTGSAFKPFVYLAALEKGYSPASLLLDAPFTVKMGDGYWRPQNIEKKFFGINTLRTALERSMNATMVRLAQQMGMRPIIEVARRFGIYNNLPPMLATVLGSEETTLIRLTSAYAMLVNGGKKIQPILIDRIQDRHGKTLYKSDQRPCPECHEPYQGQLPPIIPDGREQVVDPISAYQIVSILEGVMKRGTGKRLQIDNQIIAVKSGTSNDYKDTWCIGFSKDLVVGVFVGFDQPRSLGRFNTGSTVAGPIFKMIMEHALKDKPAQPFTKPKGAQFVQVNRLTGARATPQDRDTILEVFKPNQGPNSPAAVQRAALEVSKVTSHEDEEEGTSGVPLPMEGVY